MAIFKYIKTAPTDYLIQYRKGKKVREGAGLAFWYYQPNNVLVQVPMATRDVNFMFAEVTQDFQEVTVQGRVTYKVAEPATLANVMNYTLKPNGQGWAADDPEKLEERVLNLVQVAVQRQLRRRGMRELLAETGPIQNAVQAELIENEVVNVLGLAILDVALQAIRPTPETARALEAEMRERVLKEADDAVYARRNAALEQERQIQETELNNQKLLEMRKRDVTETRMDAEEAEQARRQEIDGAALQAELAEQDKRREAELQERTARQANKLKLETEQTATALRLNDQRQAAELKARRDEQETALKLEADRMATDLALAEDRQKVVEMDVEGERKRAEVEVYRTQATLEAYKGMDPKALLAMNAADLQPAQAIMLALQGLAETGFKIGEVNLGPDLIQQVMKQVRTA